MNLPPIIFESFSPALLLGIRLGGLMTFAPFVGSVSIPWQVKSGLTVALTALLGPAYAASMTHALPTNLVAAVAGELMIGMGMGLTMRRIFEGARSAGQILGLQSGYSL